MHADGSSAPEPDRPEPGPDNGRGRPQRGMVDVLGLPDPSRALMTWLTRSGGASLAEAAAQTGQEEGVVSSLLDALAADGYLEIRQENGAPRYTATVGHRQARRTPRSLWNALE